MMDDMEVMSDTIYLLPLKVYLKIYTHSYLLAILNK